MTDLRFIGGRWDGSRDQVGSEPERLIWLYTCPGEDTCAVCTGPTPDPIPQDFHLFNDRAMREAGGPDELTGEWWRYRYERRDRDGTWVYVINPPSVGPAVDKARGELVYA